MSNLPILDVKKPKMKEDSAPYPLMPHPFNLVISAAPRSGKTNLLMSLIGASHMYGRNYWDTIYFFSPSCLHDQTTKFILPKLDNVVVISDPAELDSADMLVGQIMRDQMKAKEEDREKILIIMDDMASDLARNKQLQKTACRFRHGNCSIITLVQSYKTAPLLIRNCMTGFIVFNVASEKEFEKISEEVLDRFPNGRELCRYATRQRYNFCYVNVEKAEMWHNFDTILYDKATDPDMN
jgi:hypothetical protein